MDLLLNRLERATSQEDQENYGPNVPASSKAYFRPRKRAREIPDDVPNPLARHRYGTESATPSLTVASDDSPNSARAREDRRRRNEDRVQQVTGLWHRVDHPTAHSPIILTESIDPDISELLRKGRKYAELASDMGFNPEAKRPRQIARDSALCFDGASQEYTDAVGTYDLEIIRIRGRASAHKPEFASGMSMTR